MVGFLILTREFFSWPGAVEENLGLFGAVSGFLASACRTISALPRVARANCRGHGVCVLSGCSWHIYSHASMGFLTCPGLLIASGRLPWSRVCTSSDHLSPPGDRASRGLEMLGFQPLAVAWCLHAVAAAMRSEFLRGHCDIREDALSTATRVLPHEKLVNGQSSLRTLQ